MMLVVRVSSKCCWEMECWLPGSQLTCSYCHVTMGWGWSCDHNVKESEMMGVRVGKHMDASVC